MVNYSLCDQKTQENVESCNKKLACYNKEKGKNPLKSLLISEDFLKMVRVTGFEPAASCSQTDPRM